MMSSIKKRPKFDVLARSETMNRSLRVKDRKRRIHDQIHVGIQDKLEREIKLRDGAARLLSACTHEDQLLEAAKTLHTSNARMYTYMAELQKLKTAEVMDRVMNDEGIQSESKVCSGRVALSDLRIPLMWNDAERYTGMKSKDIGRYAVFCLVRVGGEVQDTELICTDKTTTDVSFRDVLVFEDASHKFQMNIEIFAFPMSDESISAPTPQKLLARLNRSIGKSEGKKIKYRLRESPTANMRIAPQYENLGSLTLDLTCIDESIKSHDITQLASLTSASARAKPLLPLYGSLTCRLVAQPRCITDKCITGFLHCMDVIGGVPSWTYMWCEVKAGKMRCWLNPEDVVEKRPKKLFKLIAHDIRINEIEKSRQRRPNSFQVRDLEIRHIFSAVNKDDLSKWIKGLRQHKYDFSAWSVACPFADNDEQPVVPMYIASPSPSKVPSHLLFEHSTYKTQLYDQMSISSPTQSVVDENEITDLLHKREENRSIAADMIEAKQSAPWTSLFTGALNRPVTKVTKLQDVQNIATPTSTRPRAYARARSLDLDSHSCKNEKSAIYKKKKASKPPIPRRPSQDVLDERTNLYKSSPSSKAVPRIEGLKNCINSDSCSETGLSDFCQSSDDVFLSGSDENMLTSSSRHRKKKSPNIKSRPPCRRKKRHAPLPPTETKAPEPADEGRQSMTKSNSRSTSRASISSASSLDDILETNQKLPSMTTLQICVSERKPTPTQRMIYQNMEPEERKSQLSLNSNSTQLSTTSSGYKSDTEGLIMQLMSPLPIRKASHEDSSSNANCEILVTERDVIPRNRGRMGVRVLPTGTPLPNGRDGRKVYSRSKSCDPEKRSHSSSGERLMSRNGNKSKVESHSYTEFSNFIPVDNYNRDIHSSCTKSSKPPVPKPIPAPRRSYLTAIESSKPKSKENDLGKYHLPSTNHNEDHGVRCQPRSAPRTLNGRSHGIQNTNSNSNVDYVARPNVLGPFSNEPIYARINKQKKTKDTSVIHSCSSSPTTPSRDADAVLQNTDIDNYSERNAKTPDDDLLVSRV